DVVTRRLRNRPDFRSLDDVDEVPFWIPPREVLGEPLQYARRVSDRSVQMSGSQQVEAPAGVSPPLDGIRREIWSRPPRPISPSGVAGDPSRSSWASRIRYGTVEGATGGAFRSSVIPADDHPPGSSESPTRGSEAPRVRPVAWRRALRE